jgi:hypothetical protein
MTLAPDGRFDAELIQQTLNPTFLNFTEAFQMCHLYTKRKRYWGLCYKNHYSRNLRIFVIS